MKRGNVDIHIATDGSRTVVEAYLHTYLHRSVSAAGSSARDPQDKADKKTGEALAVARALRHLAAKLERQAYGEMKHREDCARHAAEIEAQRKGLELQEALKTGAWWK